MSHRVEKPNQWTHDGTEAFLALEGFGVGRGAGCSAPWSRTSWVTAQNSDEQARCRRASPVRRTVLPRRNGRAVKASAWELFVLIGTFYG